MAPSIELLKSMNGSHAINALRAAFDPMVNTDLEAFLIDWLETLIDDDYEHQPIADAMENHSFEAHDIKALGAALIEDTAKTVELLSVLSEEGIDDADVLKGAFALTNVLENADIDTPENLTAELELATKFRALASDAGGVFTRLTTLASTTQE